MLLGPCPLRVTHSGSSRKAPLNTGGTPLVRRYGPGPVEDACRTAVDLDVVSVTEIAAMLAKALETTPPQAPNTPVPGTGTPGRFARDPCEFAAPLTQSRSRRHLAVVPDPTQEDPTR